jgi:5'-deoxynucleotidase YfbR-like HD superfamily hydrolase
VAERGAGDLPAPAKVARPALRFEYEELEAEIRVRFGLDTCFSTDEQEWVNACDLIEFLLFMFEERLMGNQYSAPKIKAVSKYLQESLNAGNIPVELDGIIGNILRYGVKPLTDNFILGITEE